LWTLRRRPVPLGLGSPTGGSHAAVRDFQRALHQDIPSVTVDGIVGPITWRALVSGMLSF
jgi:peptidoglycan hydrolase-like protein with peptidoglycan-binding domain